LKDVYDSANSDQMQRVKMQAQGEARSPSAFGTYPPVNFMEDDFQKEFRTREKGNKSVIQSTLDDATEGTFLPRALNFYTEQANDPKLSQYKSLPVHHYNARNSSTYYSTLNSSALGVLNRYGL
jgi:hypothetical protein